LYDAVLVELMAHKRLSPAALMSLSLEGQSLILCDASAGTIKFNDFTMFILLLIITTVPDTNS